MKRTAISKKVRFEVFKRDGFKCQYCGASAPEAVLEVDHIQPVSKGGKNDILNLITACHPCNNGKSDRALSDGAAVTKQIDQLQELQERREQLEMLLKWRNALTDIQADEVQAIAAAWSAVAPSWNLNDTGLKEAKKLLKKYGLQHVLDAIETAGDSYVKTAGGKATAESVNLAWSKVHGICALNAMPESERRLYYIRAILQKRLSYVPFDVMAHLSAALHGGVDIQQLEAQAKRCRSWNQFSEWLYG